MSDKDINPDILIEAFLLISKGKKINKNLMKQIEEKARECCNNYGNTYAISDFFKFCDEKNLFENKNGIYSFLTSEEYNLTLIDLKIRQMLCYIIKV